MTLKRRPPPINHAPTSKALLLRSKLMTEPKPTWDVIEAAADELMRLHQMNSQLLNALSEVTFAIDTLGWKRLGVRLTEPYNNAKAAIAFAIAQEIQG